MTKLVGLKIKFKNENSLKILNKSVLFIACAISILLSCNNSHVTNDEIIKKDTVVHQKVEFRDSLIETPLDSSGYYISIPRGYVIRTIEMSMTYKTMYFFMPSDTSDNAKANGVLSIGLGKYTLLKSESQKIITSEFLGTNKEWRFSGYSENFMVETTAEVEMERYISGIHATGYAGSDAELTKLLEIFSTFKRK